ncbi:MAG: 5-oxoprolinase subunit PxpB [Alphaproteobacteria bacterium]|nr:5-oxoprolinase subunit PxpB [Alphaproteobacteria bacterium]
MVSKTTDMPLPRILPAGDMALVVEFGDAIDPAINARTLAFDAAIAAAAESGALSGIVETVPTYRSVLVHYDPLVIGFEALSNALSGLSAGDRAAEPGRLWTVPTVFGGEHGIDLEFVATTIGARPSEVIDLFLSAEYRVYMIGFAPGFAYLGGSPERLHLPRRPEPRARVPAGTVSVGGMQAAINSMEMPSGWHLLGRTPARVFDLRRDPPFLFRPGDRIRFTSVEDATFRRLARDAEAGAYMPACSLS